MIDGEPIPPGFGDATKFTLIEALLGRRARRFFMGATIPDGYFTYTSKHEPKPLSELEQMTLLTAMAGNTAWHYMIMRGEVYVPHRSRVRKINDGRLKIPPQLPYVEAHNTWVVNHPGTTLVIPVGDLAQHVLAGLCYYTQNKICFYDDINKRSIEGIDRFRDIVDVEKPLPLSFLELWSFAELTAELSTSCYAGMLMLQAMGLGGWMFNGMDPFSVLGTSGNSDVPGLGFRYDSDERWAMPNPTGLEGIFEAYCPPHHKDMHAAVDALVERKFGPRGPFHPDTPGPWKESGKVRSSANVHDEIFRECIATQAQYIFDTFGKFPGTVPSIYVMPYLQAHHLDLEFYDHFFKPGAYLKTHAQHMEKWHPENMRC